MEEGRLERTFDQFHDAVQNNGVFDVKTTVLFHLAVAIAVGCYP